MSHHHPSENDNWLAPTFLADPYTYFRQIREQDPVHWNTFFGFWTLTRYSDVLKVFQDARRFSNALPFNTRGSSLSEEDRKAMGRVAIYIHMFMTGMDPPLHTRQRTLIQKSFTPRVIERMRGRTQQVVTELISAVLPLGEFDLMRDLAFPLPSTIIFELLGIPLEHREAIRASSETISSFVSLVTPAPGQMQQMVASLDEVAERLKPLIAERRAAPQNDLLSLLVHAEEQGEHLSEQELIIMCTMLLFAGHETTTNLLGNGMVALLQQREQWELLKARPELLPQAIDEILRFASSVMIIPRIATQDVELDGKQVHKGERVMLSLAGANRDPEQFSEPDQLNIQRKPERTLSFGHGIHYCVGAALAKMEAQTAIAEILRQLPDIHLASDTLAWRPSITMRGLASLPLKFGSTSFQGNL